MIIWNGQWIAKDYFIESNAFQKLRFVSNHSEILNVLIENVIISNSDAVSKSTTNIIINGILSINSI